jgi:UDP-N-acetylmuramyl pentapeptide synthase
MDSSYNAAPKSMKQVIDNFIKLHTLLFPKHKIMFCLGEMREL